MEKINIEEVTLLIFELSEELFSNYIIKLEFINQTVNIEIEEKKFKEKSFSEFMNFLLSDDDIIFEYKKKSLDSAVFYYNNLHKRLDSLLKNENSSSLIIKEKLLLNNLTDNIIKKSKENLDLIINLENKVIKSLDGDNISKNNNRNKNKF